MSSFSSNNSYGLCRLGSKRLAGNKSLRRRRGFKQDPVVVLSYFVFFGVLISGLSSFGL